MDRKKRVRRMDKVVFLDRDGVINKNPAPSDYVKNWDEFEFLPEIFDSIKLLNDNGFKVVVITNQAGVAKGKMTLETLNEIHTRMGNELKKMGARIDAIYFCPHRSEDGCACRKPKPGMLLNAARDMGFDVNRAVFIGDDERDIEAGKAAGCKTIKVVPNGSILETVKGIVGLS
jgi:histidinol-phosphate phosphatase family protein